MEATLRVLKSTMAMALAVLFAGSVVAGENKDKDQTAENIPSDANRIVLETQQGKSVQDLYSNITQTLKQQGFEIQEKSSKGMSSSYKGESSEHDATAMETRDQREQQNQQSQRETERSQEMAQNQESQNEWGTSSQKHDSKSFTAVKQVSSQLVLKMPVEITSEQQGAKLVASAYYADNKNASSSEWKQAKYNDGESKEAFQHAVNTMKEVVNYNNINFESGTAVALGNETQETMNQ